MTATEAHTVKGRLSVACFTSPGSRKASRLVLQVNVYFGASCLHHITSHKLYANPFFSFPCWSLFIMTTLVLRKPFTQPARIVEGIQMESLGLWYCNSPAKGALILRRMFGFFSLRVNIYTRFSF